ncbi:MAG: hypothetical protein ABI614_17665, partial [Planctomycetota bacterium]
RAVRLYRQTLDLADASRADHATIRTELAAALVNAGQSFDAAREYERAADEQTPELRQQLLRDAAYQYCVSGHIGQGKQMFRELLAPHGLRLDESFKSNVLEPFGKSTRRTAFGCGRSRSLETTQD